jgi:hypothetical protein
MAGGARACRALPLQLGIVARAVKSSSTTDVAVEIRSTFRAPLLGCTTDSLDCFSVRHDRTRFLIFCGNPLRWLGDDHTRCNQDVRHPGIVLIQTLVIARTPHAVGNLVVLDGTSNLCNQARYVSVVKAPRHAPDVTGQKLFRNLRERMALSVLANRFR